jgi:hypothetical protein
MGAVSGEPDSGGACLRRIVQWALDLERRHTEQHG